MHFPMLYDSQEARHARPAILLAQKETRQREVPDVYLRRWFKRCDIRVRIARKRGERERKTTIVDTFTETARNAEHYQAYMLRVMALLSPGQRGAARDAILAKADIAWRKAGR